MKNEKTLSRREKERLRHREEILEAAKRVFIESGYNSATMESIATEAEFSLATLYKFFGSKENLFMEILLQMLEKLEQQSEEILNRPSTCRERLEALFDARMELHWENPGLITLVEDVVKNHHGDLECLVDLKKRYITYVNRMCLFFSEGISKGEFEDKGDRNLALVHEGMLHMYFGSLSENRNLERNRADEKALLSIFLEGAAASPQEN